MEVLRQRVVGGGSPCIVLRCSPYHISSALYPVIEHLQRVLQFERDDTPEEKLRKLEEVLVRTGMQIPSPSRGAGQGGGEADAPVPPIPTFPRQGGREPLGEVVSLFAALLSVPLPEGPYPPLLLTPQRQRQQTLDALVAWLLAEAERQPVLAVWEDLHWADPSTLELLGLVIDQAPTAHMLTLVTYRPEFRPPWAPRSHLTQLTLGRLPQLQVETMVRQLTGGKPLPAEVRAQVVAKTDGVPLFVEELVKMILESGLVRQEADHYTLTGPLPPMAIPATLQDSLMARLDRLATARAVAQLGAVLGREFAYELIAAVAPLDERSLQQGLAELVDAELLYQRGRPPQARYLFKHALIQETAYQSLLKSTRQQYHQRIAQVLVERFAEIQETQPELLAHHYTEAGLTAQAVPYRQQAGQRALERSAHVEAISHLAKGLELVTMLPETVERSQQELTLCITFGAALRVTQGSAASEVEHSYARARELCRHVGDTPQLFPALWGLWAFYHNRAAYRTAHELGDQLLSLAQPIQDPARLLQAHRALGETLWQLGVLTAAQAHLEQAIALYDHREHRSLAFLYGGPDPGVSCRFYSAWNLWLLGYPEQALQRSQETLSLAQQLAHPLNLAYAHHLAAMVHQCRREGRVVQERAEAEIALAHEQGFAALLAMGTIRRGWALAEQGHGEEGIAQMHHGLAALQAMGAELARPHYLALLTEAYGKRGQAEQGLSRLAEALSIVEKNEERWWEAELYRLKGELVVQQAGRRLDEAETCFRQALDVAHRQEAKSLELRAAMSLARLWQRQGKHAEAYELLAPVYGWFTEGFDTADLQDAKALLAELARGG